MTSLAEIQAIVEQIKADLPLLINRSQIAPKQIVIVNGLSDLSERLGLLQAGEFRTGNGKEPGFGFSGVRMGYPAFSYSGQLWNIVGVNNDVIQVGIRASDGKLIAGGGGVQLSANGIAILRDSQSFLSFYDPTGATEEFAIKATSATLQVQSLLSSKEISFVQKMTDGTTPQLVFKEDNVQANRSVVTLNPGVQGARLSLLGDMGAGNDSLIDIRTQGASGGSTFVRIRETTVTPPDPGEGDAIHFYMKADKFIIQYNESAGPVRYYYLDLVAATGTWTHTTTAP